MISVLLLVGLTSSVLGLVVKMTETVYEAEENDNITIRWDSHSKTEMSHANLLCVLRSKPLKVLYEMVHGVEVVESQHQQFAGRVQCDGDALREGRIRLHVSTVTAEDSGNYRCDLAANYDQTTSRWTIRATEHFVLNVTSNGGSGDEFLGTPKLTEGVKHDWNKVKNVLGTINGGLIVAAGLVLIVDAVVKCVAALFR